MYKDKFTWGNKSEKKFVDGIGCWKEPNPDPAGMSVGARRYWLTLYVAAHETSPHEHHKTGVQYAKRKLSGLRQR